VQVNIVRCPENRDVRCSGAVNIQFI